MVWSEPQQAMPLSYASRTTILIPKTNLPHLHFPGIPPSGAVNPRLSEINLNVLTTRYFLRPLAATGFLLALLFTAGCKHDYNAQPVAGQSLAVNDPAAANMAPVSGGQPVRVLGQSDAYTPQQQDETYDPNAAQPLSNDPVYEQTQAPPPLQTSEQPPAPGPNYIWTPGYWGNGPSGYVWVTGTWSRPPYTGALWTPPYWGYTNNRYRFHSGYWGHHIGYYGGIDYGNGYIGTGYYGGYWNGPNFYYNRRVNHLGGGIGFAYDRPVFYGGINYGFGPHVNISFNGGPGGIAFGPRPYEYAAMREEHRGFGMQVGGDHREGLGRPEGHFDNGFHGDHGGGFEHDRGGDHGGGDHGGGDHHDDGRGNGGHDNGRGDRH